MKKMYRLLILLFVIGLLGCASNNALTLYKQGQKALEDRKYVEAYEFFKRTLLEQMAQSAKKIQKAEIPDDLKQKEESLLNQLSAIENQWEDAYKKGEDVLKG